MAPAHDYRVENHGSLFLFVPASPEALDDLLERVGEDTQWFGGALAVEPRYARDLAQGLLDEGYIVV